MAIWKHKMFNNSKYVSAALFFVFFSLPSVQAQERIYFPSLDNQMKVSGEWFKPKDKDNFPAVIVVHGTNGVDERGRYWARVLPPAGIAVFLVDFKTGVYSTAQNRPPTNNFLPALFAALQTVRAQQGVDKEKIGMLGFSLGGHLALTSSLKTFQQKWIPEQKGFSFHVSYYGGCKFFLRKMKELGEKDVTAPIQVHWGALDGLDEEDYCPKLKDAIQQEIGLFSYKDSYHGFDGTQTFSYDEPNNPGKKTILAPNEEAKTASHKEILNWIKIKTK